jgi:hypothetical protein
MEVLRLLVNFLTVAEYFNTDYEKDFEKEWPVGASIQVKFPQTFTIRDGLGYSPQGINRIATTVSLDQPFGVDFEWDDYEAAVKAERSEAEIREQYLQPAAAQIAQEIDSRAAQFGYQNASNVVGALGTDPTGVATYYNARRRLQELACPNTGKRALCISSSMMSTFGQNITTFFHPGDELSEMFKDGHLGRAAGFDWYESNSLYSHTAGTAVTSLVVSGAGQSGSSLVVQGTNGQTLKKGDKISLNNVNQVNPRTRRIPGAPVAKNFTVTQDFTLTGGAADSISILPAIYGPGSPYQNVDALPADQAAITLWPGTTSPSGKVGTAALAITKFAFALVGGQFYTPKAVEAASQKRDPQTGIPVRFVKAWDPVRSMQIHRFDTLIGFGNLYQDNGAVVVAGA